MEAAKPTFEEQLSGGHHNSLGNTEEVTKEVLNNAMLFDELFNCYFSNDELVRLRTSSAIKRVCMAQPETVEPYINRLIEEISNIEQASTQWTLAILFDLLKTRMSAEQISASEKIMKHNLTQSDDWIVLNTTMETLMKWAKEDSKLKNWLLPELLRLSKDDRKSVSKRGEKYLKLLA